MEGFPCEEVNCNGNVEKADIVFLTSICFGGTVFYYCKECCRVHASDGKALTTYEGYRAFYEGGHVVAKDSSGRTRATL